MTRKTRVILIFTLVPLFLALGSPARAMLLKGEIEHSEVMPPVDSRLLPGQVFDEANLPTFPGAGANSWYRIPGWLAGVWRNQTQTNYYRLTYATQETDTTVTTVPAQSTGSWGTQHDGQGRIWQFNPAPFVGNIDAGDEMVVQIVRTSEPVESTEQAFVKRSTQTEIRVDKQTRVIKTVRSGEQITSYVPEGDGLIKRETSSKVFDAQGKPVILGKSFSYEQRIAPFLPQDTYQGRDMKALFAQFLADQGGPSTP